AKAYCDWLAHQTGKPYRLLTGDEWEYACRAETTTKFAYGDSISTSKARYGWLAWSTVEVGRFPPNLWGLFDVHGNVWEWVEDVSNHDSHAAQDQRVLRGGSFRCAESTLLRADFCSFQKYMESRDDVGFRVGRTL